MSSANFDVDKLLFWMEFGKMSSIMKLKRVGDSMLPYWVSDSVTCDVTVMFLSVKKECK